MRFELLVNCPRNVRTVAEWLFKEWGDPALGQSPEQLTENLFSRMSKDSLPMHLLALDGEKPVGFVALKLREMDCYPEREHWLGSLYVPAELRGKGIGGALVEELIRRCPDYGVTHLSLQTERLDGGIYRRYGWLDVEFKELSNEKLLIMERKI